MFKLVFRSPSTWIYHLGGSAPYFTATNAGCNVRPHGRQSAQLTCAGPTTLIRRETDLPGWSAQVDGHAVPVHHADGIFQEVSIGAGVHRVAFSYAPPNVGLGFVALTAGCAWLLLAAVSGRRRRPA
jgi:hypothetical protein